VKAAKSQLDVVSLVKNNHRNSLVTQTLLTKPQAMMIRCHKSFTIANSGTDGSDQGFLMNKIFDDIAYNVTSPNLPVAVFTLGKINKILEPYKTTKKLTDLDLKLILNSCIDFNSDDEKDLILQANDPDKLKLKAEKEKKKNKRMRVKA
jgi:hypothetical protein